MKTLTGREEEYITSTNGKSIEELWIAMQSKLSQLLYKFVPVIKSSSSLTWTNLGEYPIDRILQDAVRKKHTTHRQWMQRLKRYGNAVISRLAYIRARNKVTKLLRQAKRKFESDVAAKSKTNPKAFWRHVNNKLKTKVGVSPLLEDDNNKQSIKFSDIEKANILQKQFCSVFTNEPAANVPTPSYKTDASISNLHTISGDMVKKEIMAMNVNKSCGQITSTRAY